MIVRATDATEFQKRGRMNGELQASRVQAQDRRIEITHRDNGVIVASLGIHHVVVFSPNVITRSANTVVRMLHAMQYRSA